MRQPLLLVVVLLALARAAAADGPVYELPADHNAAVLTLDYRGGFGPPREDKEPHITIRADGRIDAAHVKAGTKLGADELQDLLRFVIAKHKMLLFDRKAVEAKARGEVYITDQSDTILTIAIKGRAHKVSYYGSTWAAQHFPKVAELQSLEAVRKRLHSIWCLAQLGGAAAAQKILDRANAELKKRHAAVRPLTPRDFEWVYHDKAGSRRVRIVRWGAERSTGAHVTLPREGPPTVDVFVQPR